MNIHVNDRKYTFVKDGLVIKILRYGEEWHQQSEAFNALTSIMCELDAARVVLAAARALEAAGDAPMALREALTKHARLVGDCELPSEWSAP